MGKGGIWDWKGAGIVIRGGRRTEADLGSLGALLGRAVLAGEVRVLGLSGLDEVVEAGAAGRGVGAGGAGEAAHVLVLVHALQRLASDVLRRLTSRRIELSCAANMEEHHPTG